VFPWQLDAHLYACMCLWRLAMSAWFWPTGSTILSSIQDP
jgi:hypothetical protein